jgi:hypothetical protein
VQERCKMVLPSHSQLTMEVYHLKVDRHNQQGHSETSFSLIVPGELKAVFVNI